MNVELRQEACVSIVGSVCAPTTGRLCKVTAMSLPGTLRRDAALPLVGLFVGRMLRPGAPANVSLPKDHYLSGVDFQMGSAMAEKGIDITQNTPQRWTEEIIASTDETLESTDIVARAEVLKAVADPTRLEILEMLSPQIRCNCHFQEHLELAPNLLSYHLKVLREAGLIVGTKRGRWVDYALTGEARSLIAAALPEGLRS